MPACRTSRFWPRYAPGIRSCRSRSIPACPSRFRRSRSRRWSGPGAPLPVGARHGGRSAALPRGRPVLARPSTYATTLTTRIGTHVQQIGEWLRLRLIYPHEADRLRTAYRSPRSARGRLDRREPRAHLHAGRAVSRRVPAAVRQPVLLRRRTVVRSGGRRAPAARGPRTAVRRAQRRRAPAVSPRPQSRRGRILSSAVSPAAAPADHPFSRDRDSRRAEGHARPAVPGRIDLEPAASDHHAGRLPHGAAGSRS